MICEAIMSINFLVKLSDNDKTIIIALILALVLLLALCGFLGSLIVRTMKWQGKKCDELVNEVVVNRIITSPKQLKIYARKKNRRQFLKQAWIPVVIILGALLIVLIHNIIFRTWNYNPFNVDDGFGSLFFVWDFTHMFRKPEDGVGILYTGPILINKPHLKAEAIMSYIAGPAIIVGAVWYIVAAQSYLSRTIRAHWLARKIFDKSLDGFKQNTTIVNPQVQQQQAEAQSQTTNQQQ